MNTRVHLTRIFSIRSLLGIAAVATLLVLFYRFIAVQNLIGHETNFNMSLARSLSAALWPHYAEFIRDARRLPAETRAQAPEVQSIRREVVDRLRDLRVVKVKIYDTGGLTVFSTDTGQIGEVKSGNEGYRKALAGQTASELVFRGSFSAFEQVIEDVNVLSTYIPIRRDERGAVEGVFEIYSDVTPLVTDIERTGYTILIVVTGLLLVLYGFLLTVVRRAESLLHRHEEEKNQRHQGKLEYLARYDALTDLPNRSHFMSLLGGALAQAQPGGTGLGLIYLSIDRFKLINDGLRHEYGDKVLVEFARRLRACVDDEGVLARMGGDKFAIMSYRLGSADSARQCAEHIVEQISAPIRVNGREIVLTVSLGVAVLQDGGEDTEILVENAITAMNKAKDEGRNKVVFFTRQLDPRAEERLALEMDLRNALVRREFVLYYQPRVDAATGRVTALEALLRWRHPQRGLVMPTEFVPLLEDMDLMIPVGAWVLEEACRQVRAWRVAGQSRARVSVNLSLSQFRTTFLVDTVRHALQESNLDGRCLELELTESVLADDVHKTRAVLQDLKRLGVSLAVDDFGTGYSSLSYLINFPVTCLKIDRAFVTDIPANQRHAALTAAIVAMADSLGLDTVAEGVETAGQFQFIASLGCTEVQGYWFSAPRPAQEIPALITELECGSAARRTLRHVVVT